MLTGHAQTDTNRTLARCLHCGREVEFYSPSSEKGGYNDFALSMLAYANCDWCRDHPPEIGRDQNESSAE